MTEPTTINTSELYAALIANCPQRALLFMEYAHGKYMCVIDGTTVEVSAAKMRFERERLLGDGNVVVVAKRVNSTPKDAVVETIVFSMGLIDHDS